MYSSELGIIKYAFNPNAQEVVVCRPLWVQSQSNLQREFQDSQGYACRPSLQKKGGGCCSSTVQLFSYSGYWHVQSLWNYCHHPSLSLSLFLKENPCLQVVTTAPTWSSTTPSLLCIPINLFLWIYPIWVFISVELYVIWSSVNNFLKIYFRDMISHIFVIPSW